MIEERSEELINNEIDRLNSPEETARLREIIVANPEIQTYYDDLESLNRMLHSVGEVEPPSQLKQEIVRMVRESKHEALPQKTGWLEAMAVGLRERFSLRTAFVFAGGAVAGALLLAVFSGYLTSVNMDDSFIPGTFVPVDNLDALRSVEAKPIVLDGIRGNVETQRVNGFVLATIDIESEPNVENVEIVVEFENEALDLIGIKQRRDAGNAMQLASGSVRIQHGGENQYTLILNEPAGAPSNLKLEFRAGDLYYETLLSTGLDRPER